jgi:hypothetical protein
MLSDAVQAILRPQGWSPGRKVSTRDWIHQLVSEGYTVLPQAELLLQNFGGLEITPARRPIDAYAADVIRFDPAKASAGEFERVDFWQRQLGQRLTPLGELVACESILLLGESGYVFCEWSNIIAECGSSFEDALESTLIIAQRRPLKRAVDAEGKLVPI